MTADLYIFGGVYHPVVAVSLYLKLIVHSLEDI